MWINRLTWRIRNRDFPRINCSIGFRRRQRAWLPANCHYRLGTSAEPIARAYDHPPPELVKEKSTKKASLECLINLAETFNLPVRRQLPQYISHLSLARQWFKNVAAGESKVGYAGLSEGLKICASTVGDCHWMVYFIFVWLLKFILYKSLGIKCVTKT